MKDEPKLLPCYALKRGNTLIALSFERTTVEALRHGKDGL
jgi:hypothetical protein